MTPLLSILIATRNRAYYCIYAIETILNFDYQNFELVIQDNSDNLELYNYIKNRTNDERLIYNYTPPPFSSIDNFNAVIGLAKGEYLCLIGDDDGINPEIFKAVEWALKNEYDALVPGLNAIYRWPDACKVNKQFENDNGILTISHVTGNIRFKSTHNSVKKLMKNGGQDYLNIPFPKLYHGIVKRIHLDKIKENTGHYVGGLSPDIYIAVALTKFINTIVEIDYPLTIPGICVKSAPVDESLNKYEKLQDAPHFRANENYNWSVKVPKFYCSENIWADSAIASLFDMNRNLLLNDFDLISLSALLLNKFYKYKNIIINNLLTNHEANNNIIRMYLLVLLKFKFISQWFLVYYKKSINKSRIIINKYLKKRGPVINNINILNITEATKALCQYLEIDSKVKEKVQNIFSL